MQLPSGVSLAYGWLLSASNAQIDLEIGLVTEYLNRLAVVRNERNPFLALAPELLELIADEIQEVGGMDAIDACSLVCRRLVPFTQKRLFASLRLVSPRRVSHAIALAHNRPDLCAVVRSLEIDGAFDNPDLGDETSTSDLELLLSSLSRVENLRLVGLGTEDDLMDVFPGVSRLISNATHLVIEESYFSSRTELLLFLYRATKMQYLSFIKTSCEGRIPDDPGHHIGCLEISSFKLDEYSSELACMLEYVHTQKLRDLEFVVPLARHFRLWDALLARVGGNLRSICATCGHHPEAAWLADALERHVPNIQYLKLELPLTPGSLGGLEPFIRPLKSTSLRRLSVMGNMRNDGFAAVVKLDLSGIMDICEITAASRDLPALESFEFSSLSHRSDVSEILEDLGPCADGVNAVRQDRQWRHTVQQSTYDISEAVAQRYKGHQRVVLSIRTEQKSSRFMPVSDVSSLVQVDIMLQCQSASLPTIV